MFGAEFLDGLVHGDEASKGDGAREDGASGHVAFAEDELAGDAVDAICADDGIC